MPRRLALVPVLLWAAVTCLAACSPVTAQEVPHPAARAEAEAPTSSNVAYGPHPEDVLDFWRANAVAPTAVVLYFHGGGGDKARIRPDPIIAECLAAGVSFGAVNFRDIRRGATIPDVLRECARSIQFLRANARTWNIDPVRVAVFGESFGATTSLWLAFHADLAEPANPDPILRQSTRPICAGSFSGQFSFDPFRWIDLFGRQAVDRFAGAYENPQLWGVATEDDLHGPAGRRIRADCDVISLITKDGPPVFLVAHRPDALTNAGEFLHHPKLSQLLYERCRAVGVPVVADIPALQIRPGAGEPATWRDFVFRELGVPPAPPSGS
ncbi:MAG: alpha/beta hydrolase [Opitutaceae bacterium]